MVAGDLTSVPIWNPNFQVYKFLWYIVVDTYLQIFAVPTCIDIIRNIFKIHVDRCILFIHAWRYSHICIREKRDVFTCPERLINGNITKPTIPNVMVWWEFTVGATASWGTTREAKQRPKHRWENVRKKNTVHVCAEVFFGWTNFTG